MNVDNYPRFFSFFIKKRAKKHDEEIFSVDLIRQIGNL